MASRKINIDIDRESMYAVIKQDQLAEFVKNEENPNISAEYKESARLLLLQDIAGINGILGLKATDGVEQWTKN